MRRRRIRHLLPAALRRLPLSVCQTWKVGDVGTALVTAGFTPYCMLPLMDSLDILSHYSSILTGNTINLVASNGAAMSKHKSMLIMHQPSYLKGIGCYTTRSV